MSNQSWQYKEHNDFTSGAKSRARHKGASIVIDGKKYESINDASLKTGLSTTVIKKVNKELHRTGLSQLERELMVKVTFIFKLPKEGK